MTLPLEDKVVRWVFDAVRDRRTPNSPPLRPMRSRTWKGSVNPRTPRGLSISRG